MEILAELMDEAACTEDDTFLRDVVFCKNAGTNPCKTSDWVNRRFAPPTMDTIRSLRGARRQKDKDTFSGRTHAPYYITITGIGFEEEEQKRWYIILLTVWAGHHSWICGKESCITTGVPFKCASLSLWSCMLLFRSWKTTHDRCELSLSDRSGSACTLPDFRADPTSVDLAS